ANELIEMGQMEMARTDLIRVIRLRFPDLLTPDVEQAVADQPSLPLMKTWLDAAFEAKTADDFLAVLRRCAGTLTARLAPRRRPSTRNAPNPERSRLSLIRVTFPEARPFAVPTLATGPSPARLLFTRAGRIGYGTAHRWFPRKGAACSR